MPDPQQTGLKLGGKIDYEKELNGEQLAVVQGGDGPCVVLAGAGSGKTRTIVYRVAYLLEGGVRPENILLLTFTNKSAKEMMMRIEQILHTTLPFGKGGIWGGTFHSIANRLLRMYAESIGYTPRFTILDDEDSKSLFKACLKELGYDTKNKRFPSANIVKHIVSYSRNAMVPLEQAIEKIQPKFAGFGDDFASIAEAYDRKKRLANAMDFDDLLIRMYELLQQDVEARRKLSLRFEYILVDEYQDTNAIQAALIKLLAGETPNLLVVGDDAQSIYSFRAAEVKNILDFERFYTNARIFKLETNYRSTPEILSLANDIISRNFNQYEKDLKSVRESSLKPKVVTAASANQEAEYIAEEIERLMGEGVKEGEIAVLFRATHHSQTLEFELMKRGILYDYRGGKRFFDRAHIKDVLCYMRIADNFVDEAAWRRVLNLQVGIGEVSAGKIYRVMREAGTMAQACITPVEQMVGSRVARGWKDLRDTLERLVKANEGPGGLVRAVLQSPYMEYLENEYPNASDRTDDIEQLGVFADGYDTVSEFLTEVSLNDTLLRGDKDLQAAPKPVLSTIHQAKGLEWDAVFFMHMNESSFPNRKAAIEKGGLEEERRLFYVAVTRAREHLCLTYPRSRSFDAFSTESPSLFLQEIDNSCIDTTLMRGEFGSTFSDESSSSESEFSYDFEDGYEEPAVQLERDLDDVAKRMKKVRSSFLKDV